MQEVVKKEIIKWLDAGVIYPIADSSWVCPFQCMPKNGGITVVPNERNELVPIRPITGWRVCMDYRKLNVWTEKDHFPMPFMDQMLDRLAGKGWYCFLDGWVFGLQSNFYSSRRPREDHLHFPIWDFCFQTDAI